jgi:hypothetical protein
MAQKVVFSGSVAANVIALQLPQESFQNCPTLADNAKQKRAIAQAKVKYNYPWWASKNPLEVFWGQINEEVQVVPLETYHRFAQNVMEREIFPDEFADRQALIDECLERIPKATLDKLMEKFARK